MEIRRKDGIVYTRKTKPLNLDERINIRIKKEVVSEIKQIAKEEGISLANKIRNILSEYIESRTEIDTK